MVNVPRRNANWQNGFQWMASQYTTTTNRARIPYLNGFHRAQMGDPLSAKWFTRPHPTWLELEKLEPQDFSEVVIYTPWVEMWRISILYVKWMVVATQASSFSEDSREYAMAYRFYLICPSRRTSARIGWILHLSRWLDSFVWWPKREIQIDAVS